MYGIHIQLLVDRRDGRDQVIERAAEYNRMYNSLKVPSFVELEVFTSKRNVEMIRTTRRISTKTCREIQELISKTHNVNISLGSVLNLRPFYVQKPTEREKESCLCKFCLNIRLEYTALSNSLKDDVEKSTSLSEYFGHGITCPKNANGYYDLKCIISQCRNSDCSPMSTMYSESDFIDIEKCITYHQFVIENYEYTNRKGVAKVGCRTVRKPFQETMLQLKQKIDSNAFVYLKHRFEIKNDTFLWPNICDASWLGYIFHMGFSENIACTPKHEPQDAHFSGKQTLHCSVVHVPEKECIYSYHLSDDKVHDSAFTESVLLDHQETFPDFKDYPLIRVKSDNCSTQYWCKYLFKRMSNLSQSLRKPIILYYGVNGHGRGLVDAMSRS